MTEAEIETSRGTVVVGARLDDGALGVEFACMKSTGEVVTDWAFESDVIAENESEIRRQCWDDDVSDQIDDLL